MAKKITGIQYNKLIYARETNKKEFVALMEEYADITVKPYTAYQYFDSTGHFLGDSETSFLSDILEDMGVEVIEDG